MNALFKPILMPERAKLRVEDFMTLANTGAFADYAKSELVDGDIFFMNAQFRRHGFAKQQLFLLLDEALKGNGSTLTAVVEFSVAIPPNDMPEPDIALTSQPQGDGPVPVESVALIVEVSDSTLHIDLGRKATLYAVANVPEYWVVDLDAMRIIQLWLPHDGAYTERSETALGTTISAKSLENLVINTTGLR